MKNRAEKKTHFPQDVQSVMVKKKLYNSLLLITIKKHLNKQEIEIGLKSLQTKKRLS